MTETEGTSRFRSREFWNAVFDTLGDFSKGFAFIPGMTVFRGDALKRLVMTLFGLSVPVESVDKRFAKALQSLSETSAFVNALQQEIAEQTSQLAKVKEEFEHQQKLATSTREANEAWLKEMSERMETIAKKERRWAIYLGVVAHFIAVFLLGVLASNAVSAWWKALWHHS